MCHTDLCNTEKSLCNECKLDKQLDICTGDYSKPSQKIGENEEDNIGTANTTTGVTTSSIPKSTNATVATSTYGNYQSQSQDEFKDDANEASNPLITPPWFIMLQLSSVPNMINF